MLSNLKTSDPKIKDSESPFVDQLTKQKLGMNNILSVLKTQSKGKLLTMSKLHEYLPRISDKLNTRIITATYSE